MAKHLWPSGSLDLGKDVNSSSLDLTPSRNKVICIFGISGNCGILFL